MFLNRKYDKSQLKSSVGRVGQEGFCWTYPTTVCAPGYFEILIKLELASLANSLRWRVRPGSFLHLAVDVCLPQLATAP